MLAIRVGFRDRSPEHDFGGRQFGRDIARIAVERRKNKRAAGERTEDAALISRAILRDAIALERLFDRFSQPMFSLVLRIAQYRSEPEDVLREVFWSAWVRGSDYQPRRGSPFAWVATITRHQAIDRLRARLCREKHLGAEVDWRADEEGGENGAAPLIATEIGREVRAALAKLDAGERHAVELAFFQGLDRVEIATASGIPVGTVKARIRRGMFKLREKLEPQRELSAWRGRAFVRAAHRVRPHSPHLPLRAWLGVSKNMNSNAPLTGSHLRTYRTLFQHPVSHNLSWHDVHALFREIGQVEEQPNGNLKVTRNGQVLVLHPSRAKDVSAPEELMALRHFVERSEAAVTGANGGEPHWLLEINHHEARIFRTEMNGSVPQQFLPHDPDDHFRQAHHSKDFSRGLEKPDANSFFGPVAKALAAGGPILVFGSGTGTGSEMEQFVAWAKHQHPEVARRIVGTVVVDAHHLSDAQLLAKAREFYAGHGGSLA